MRYFPLQERVRSAAAAAPLPSPQPQRCLCPRMAPSLQAEPLGLWVEKKLLGLCQSILHLVTSSPVQGKQNSQDVGSAPASQPRAKHLLHLHTLKLFCCLVHNGSAGKDWEYRVPLSCIHCSGWDCFLCFCHPVLLPSHPSCAPSCLPRAFSRVLQGAQPHKGDIQGPVFICDN